MKTETMDFGLWTLDFVRRERLPRTADTGGFLNLQLQVGVLQIASGFLKTEACTPQSDYTNSQFLIVGSRISYPARA